MSILYLSINLAVISVPILLSWVPTIYFYKNFRAVLAAFLFVSIPFIIWDIWFTSVGVWSFSPEYTLPLKIFGLPIAEILFFVTVPYAMLFVYECIAYYVPRRDVAFASIVYVFIAVVGVFAMLISDGELYTWLIGILVTLISVVAMLFPKMTHTTHFMLYLIASLIGFVLINSILTGLPIVSYDEAFNTGVRIGTIPLEDFGYLYVLNISILLIFLKFKVFEPSTDGA